MFSKRTMLKAIASSAIPIAFGCGGHDGHTPRAATLGAPAKGGLDQRGAALFVALGKTGEIAVIDVDAWRIAGKVQVAAGFYPHHLSLSPDGTKVAVGAPGSDLSGGHAGHGSGNASGALFVLDSRTGDVLAQTVVNGTAHNLAFLPDGSAVVYTLSEHGMFHIANPTTLAETGKLMVGASPLEATPAANGKLVLVANSGSGTISAVDVEAKQITSTIAVGSNPIAAWLGVGGRALVTSEADRKLSVINLSTLTATTTTIAGVPGQAAHTQNGEQIWVALEDMGKLLILDDADLKPIAEVALGTRPHGLVLSGDGAAFFVTDESAGKVFQVDVGSRQIQRSLDVGGAPNGILLRGSS